MIAIVLILAMLSAFTMTSAASAKAFTGQAGKSPIGKFSAELGGIPFFGIQNHNTGHTVFHDHDKDSHFVLNSNTNNPNGPAPPE